MLCVFHFVKQSVENKTSIFRFMDYMIFICTYFTGLLLIVQRIIRGSLFRMLSDRKGEIILQREN